jgi:bifunctional DNA-binding transcriptional regulator/antitoxin component of YhaV-PrlF toxin-antitoxin module
VAGAVKGAAPGYLHHSAGRDRDMLAWHYADRRVCYALAGMCMVKAGKCIVTWQVEMAKYAPQTNWGEATISGRGVVNLPAQVMRRTGWKRGDRLFVELLGDDVVVLVRKPEDIAEAFAGRLTHLFPDPEDTRRILAEERASWAESTAVRQEAGGRESHEAEARPRQSIR